MDSLIASCHSEAEQDLKWQQLAVCKPGENLPAKLTTLIQSTAVDYAAHNCTCDAQSGAGLHLLRELSGRPGVELREHIESVYLLAARLLPSRSALRVLIFNLHAWQVRRTAIL